MLVGVSLESVVLEILCSYGSWTRWVVVRVRGWTRWMVGHIGGAIVVVLVLPLLMWLVLWQLWLMSWLSKKSGWCEEAVVDHVVVVEMM